MKTNRIKELRNLFLEKGEVVGDIEETLGNYDGEVNLIGEGLPTITTEFCEVGIYNDIVYFTFVVYSDSYNKKLFDLLKDFSNLQIYNLRNFKETLYPKQRFDINELEGNIKNEEYFQVNFNYSIDGDNQYLFEQYSKVKDLILKSGVKIVNQLQIKLKK